MSNPQQRCPHLNLQVEPSPYAKEVGFEWQSVARRHAATTKSGRSGHTAASRTRSAAGGDLTGTAASGLPLSFPAPLVLPDDDLAWDPKHPSQSFRSWMQEKRRNKPTEDRKVLYVAAVPETTTGVPFMKDWLQPDVSGGKSAGTKGRSAKTPQSHTILPSTTCEDVISYLGAFYHGMLVKPFPHRLRFVPWEEPKPKKTKPRRRNTSLNAEYVGLATEDSATRIHARPSPDGVFKGQLNLDDILDAAIEMLPVDAYALLLLIDHDMYEDEDDDFCCGRAYGGSRVAVVSSSRYHPVLDERLDIDYAHMWPESHCKSYVEGVCAAWDNGVESPQLGNPSTTVAIISPLRAATDAARDVITPTSRDALHALWFSRLARTVAHELSHCFGIGHCVYYACIMQGTAGMAEDVRQPPYLCPVCLSKLSHAVACELQGRDDQGKEAYIQERYRAIAGFCDGWKNNGLFTGYGAWVRARLELLQ